MFLIKSHCRKAILSMPWKMYSCRPIAPTTRPTGSTMHRDSSLHNLKDSGADSASSMSSTRGSGTEPSVFSICLTHRASSSHAIRMGSRLAKTLAGFDLQRIRIHRSILHRLAQSGMPSAPTIASHSHTFSSKFGKHQSWQAAQSRRCSTLLFLGSLLGLPRIGREAWKIGVRQVAEKAMDLYTAVGGAWD